MEQRNPRLRWLIVWVLAVVWMAVVLARLSYLQLFSYSEYFTKAQHQQQRVFEISPMRGTIYDRKGRELAVSLPMDSVFGDPAEIADVERWRAYFRASSTHLPKTSKQKSAKPALRCGSRKSSRRKPWSASRT
jgi:Cell division protein FtsI/penicillin-binding protein 2